MLLVILLKTHNQRSYVTQNKISCHIQIQAHHLMNIPPHKVWHSFKLKQSQNK